MADIPDRDPIKHRLDELFASILFVAPNGGEPTAASQQPSAAPQPLQASSYPQAPLFHPVIPSPQGRSPLPTPSQASPSAPLLEQSFERLATGMFLMDLEGRLLRANPAFCHMLGYDRSQLVGASFQNLVYPPDLGPAIAVMRRLLLGTDGAAPLELRFQRKDGALVWIELRLVLLPGASKKPAFFSSLALDVSARHQAALGLLRRSQLQKSPLVAFEPLPSAPETLPAPGETKEQPEQPPDFAAAASSSASLSAGEQQWPSEQAASLGEKEFPEVVYLPASRNQARKILPSISRRAQDAPVGSQAGGASRPLAALALSTHGPAGVLPSPWQRLALGQMPFAGALLLYLLGIALAEAVTTFASPQLGLVIHAGLLMLIFLHASIGAGLAEQKFLFTLALAPLIRLMSLSMPLLEFQFLYWYMIIGAPLFLSVWLVFRLTGYTPRDVGLSLGSGVPLQIGVALTGLALGYLEYIILRPEPLVESFSWQSIWLPALILLVFTGFLEELIFRGLMQRASFATLGKLGPVYVSMLFAVLHIGYGSLADFVFVFLVGFFFSLVVERTRSLLGVTLAHGLTNIALFLIFPFLAH